MPQLYQTAIFLEDAFDLNNLEPGFYVAVAPSDAYLLFNALEAEGLVRHVGSRSVHNHTFAATFLVGNGAGRVQANAAGRILIGREWFVKAIDDYRDWRQKWWREALQNSIDAGAKHIYMYAREAPDKSYWIGCIDDGRGMTPEVLFERFLVLGGTTKTGAAPEGIGGFGKAKELLLMPWLHYFVQAGDLIVCGSGNDYDPYIVQDGKWVFQPTDFRSKNPLYAPPEHMPAQVIEGVHLCVHMSADSHTDAEEAAAVIEKCYFPRIVFTVNGERKEAKLKAQKEVRSWPNAAVYFNDLGKKYQGDCRQYVRVSGMWMYDTWIDDAVRGNIIIELKGTSRELMTANREDIRDEKLKYELTRFAAKIAADTQSAREGPKDIAKKQYSGTGKFTPEGYKKLAAEALMYARPKVTEKGATVNLEELTRFLDDLLKRGLLDLLPSKEMMSGKFRGTDHVQRALSQLIWKPDFLVMSTIENFRAPARYLPDRMTPTNLKLSKIWAEFCRFVLIQLGSDRKYGVGWMFSESARAALHTSGNEQWLLLNPYADPDNQKGEYDITSDGDLNTLYVLAVHECTHLVDALVSHSDVFAAAFGRNMAICLPGAKHLGKIAKAIRARGAIVGTLKDAEQLEKKSVAPKPPAAMEITDFGITTPVFKNALITPGQRGVVMFDFTTYSWDMNLEDHACFHFESALRQIIPQHKTIAGPRLVNVGDLPIIETDPDGRIFMWTNMDKCERQLLYLLDQVSVAYKTEATLLEVHDKDAVFSGTVGKFRELCKEAGVKPPAPKPEEKAPERQRFVVQEVGKNEFVLIDKDTGDQGSVFRNMALGLGMDGVLTKQDIFYSWYENSPVTKLTLADIITTFGHNDNDMAALLTWRYDIVVEASPELLQTGPRSVYVDAALKRLKPASPGTILRVYFTYAATKRIVQWNGTLGEYHALRDEALAV